MRNGSHSPARTTKHHTKNASAKRGTSTVMPIKRQGIAKA
jgi:hypothetical protein